MLSLSCMETMGGFKTRILKPLVNDMFKGDMAWQ